MIGDVRIGPLHGSVKRRGCQVTKESEGLIKRKVEGG